MTGGPRLTLAAFVGAMVAMVLTGGVVSATARGGIPWAGGNVKAASEEISPLRSDTTAPSTSTTSAAPTSITAAPAVVSPSPTTSRPSPTATTRGSSSATTSTGPVNRSTRAGYGPHSDGAVEVPFSAGQTSWSVVSNGVTITLRTDIARPKAGDIIRFQVEVSGPGQSCCDARVLFGDGGQYSPMHDRCYAPATTARFETRHAYNLDGRWTFNVSGQSGGCAGAPLVIGELFGTIEVAPGITTAQGPVPPTVLVDSTVQPQGHENDYSWLSLAGMVDDSEGWVRRILVDWGDGTPPTVVPQHPGLPCNPHPVTGWPNASKQLIASGTVVHHYTTPGIYTVTIVGVSTACDGVSEVQQTAKTIRWQAG